MNDSIKPKGLRDEWSLLLHSFLDENSENSELLEKMPASAMSLDQIKIIKKELGSKRKKMNQSIEKIKIKIKKKISFYI